MRCTGVRPALQVRDYNKILHALDAEERKLFAERIRYLDKRITPGVVKLNWTSGKQLLDYFVKEARKHCKEVEGCARTRTRMGRRPHSLGLRNRCAFLASGEDSHVGTCERVRKALL